MWDYLDLSTKRDLYNSYRELDSNMSYSSIKDDFNKISSDYNNLISQANFQSLTNINQVPIINNKFNNQYNSKTFTNLPTQSENSIGQILDNTQVDQNKVWIPTQNYSYKTPKQNYDFENNGIQGFLDLAKQEGINLRVTSRLRPGAKTKQGRLSYHALGKAADIVPGEGETWDSVVTKFKNSPTLYNYLQASNLGILDETTKDMLAKTGGTGAHWHIGPDKIAIKGREKFYGKIPTYQDGGWIAPQDNTRIILPKYEPKYINDGGVLVNLGGKPSDDLRSSSKRNEDYWNPVKGASKRWITSVDTETNPLVGLDKTIGKSITGAAALSGIGYAGTKALQSVMSNPSVLSPIARQFASYYTPSMYADNIVDIGNFLMNPNAKTGGEIIYDKLSKLRSLEIMRNRPGYRSVVNPKWIEQELIKGGANIQDLITDNKE